MKLSEERLYVPEHQGLFLEESPRLQRRDGDVFFLEKEFMGKLVIKGGANRLLEFQRGWG